MKAANEAVLSSGNLAMGIKTTIEKWNGRTIRTEDGYLTDEAMQMLCKRIEEEKAKSGDAKKPAKKPAQKPEKKPAKKSK